MLAKSLSFLAGADAAGIVLGARVPIILTSRADSVMTRLASCAVAVLVAKARRESAKRRWRDAMADVILVLNAGSSSLKFSVFDADQRRSLPLVLRGQIEGLYTAPRFVAEDAQGAGARCQGLGRGHRARTRRRDRLPGRLPARATSAGHELVAVGHRVVHGGMEFAQPVRVDAGVVARARPAEPAGAAAPAAQPRADRDRRASCVPSCRRSPASTPRSIAAQPEVAQAFALPAVDHRARRAALRLPRPLLRVHRQRAAAVRREGRRGPHRSSRTWATAAACARWSRGRSVASTMGFTAVDGLPMGTRCGNLDPGVILYLMDELKMDARAIEDLIYKQVGPARRLRRLERHARAARERATRARASRSSCSPTASAASSARWPRPPAASTRWCSPPASASTPRRSASASAATRPGSAWSSIPRPTRRGGPRISTPVEQGVGVGDPDQRGTDDRAPHAARWWPAAAPDASDSEIAMTTSMAIEFPARS